jgi:hypothetical protein
VFTAAGAMVGTEILVNTTTASSQYLPQISALSNGGFVVTWTDNSGTAPDTSDSAVRAQVFTAAGAMVGTEILVNTTTNGYQYNPQITALSSGGFVVTWTDDSVSGGDISVPVSCRAQVFTAAGAMVGTEILVNTATTNNQNAPQITALSNGGFVVTWQDESQTAPDTDGIAVRAQVFNVGPTAVEQVALSLKGTGFTVCDPDAGDVLTVTLCTTYGLLSVTAGTSGASVAGSGTNTVTLTGTAAQIAALLNTDGTSTVSFLANTDAPPASATITLAADDGAGGTASTSLVLAIEGVNDAPAATGLPTDVTVTEDVASDLDLSAITLSDPDGDALTVVLAASAGTMTATSGGGVTVTNSGTGAITMTGAASAIDSFLNTASAVQYTGASNANGDNAATVTISANDGSGAVTLGVVNIDIITGTGGTDTLTPTSGDDAINGGGGDDTADYSGAGGGVTVYLTRTGPQDTGGSGSDTLTSIENLTGSGYSDALYGNGGSNTLRGGGGGDVLNGGAGADTMIGGTGNDNYTVDSAGDVITELGGEGTDKVNASFSYTLGANLEDLALRGSGNLTGTGNELNNKLFGNGGNNVLNGMAGADTLHGGAGSDTLAGGTGNDALYGEAGADIFVIGQDSVGASAQARAGDSDRFFDLSFAQNDRIDLSAIDANTVLDGDQAFAFVASFSKAAGQAVLSYNASTNRTTLTLDVDGDGKADYNLTLDGNHAGTGSNLYTGSGDTNGGWVL